MPASPTHSERKQALVLTGGYVRDSPIFPGAYAVWNSAHVLVPGPTRKPYVLILTLVTATLLMQPTLMGLIGDTCVQALVGMHRHPQNEGVPNESVRLEVLRKPRGPRRGPQGRSSGSPAMLENHAMCNDWQNQENERRDRQAREDELRRQSDLAAAAHQKAQQDQQRQADQARQQQTAPGWNF